MPARLLAALSAEKQIISNECKTQMLRQAHFFKWLRFHHEAVLCLFLRLGAEKTRYGNGHAG